MNLRGDFMSIYPEKKSFLRNENHSKTFQLKPYRIYLGRQAVALISIFPPL